MPPQSSHKRRKYFGAKKSFSIYRQDRLPPLRADRKIQKYFYSFRSPCYDISDPKWRNNKAMNHHNEDQLTLSEILFWCRALCYAGLSPQLFILSIDFWQLSRLDCRFSIEHLMLLILDLYFQDLKVTGETADQGPCQAVKQNKTNFLVSASSHKTSRYPTPSQILW